MNADAVRVLSALKKDKAIMERQARDFLEETAERNRLRNENKNLAVQLSDSLGRIKRLVDALETAEFAFHSLGKPMLADSCKRAIEGK